MLDFSIENVPTKTILTDYRLKIIKLCILNSQPLRYYSGLKEINVAVVYRKIMFKSVKASISSLCCASQ